LRAELRRILAAPPNVLSPRMVRVIEGLAEDWRRLDERINYLSAVTAPKSMALMCRWRSRPQHHKQTFPHSLGDAVLSERLDHRGDFGLAVTRVGQDENLVEDVRIPRIRIAARLRP
jgi:hypothetical protein